MIARRLAGPLAAIALVASSMVWGSTPAHASVTVDGAGSTWSSIAVTQWAADVGRQGLSINFQANGSTAGRVYYYSDQVDFAVSEIPFQAAYRDSTGTVTTNEIQLATHRPWAYLPIVAGGTSFMYHLDINGKRFANLNLAPDVIAKIFTGVIKTWNDPAIAADNPGVPLPGIAIKPVIRSDGSGTTAQFTAFMASQTPATWSAFCQKVGLPASCPPTSLYPEFDGSVGQQLSDGVAAFVAAPYNNGAITYVEYGYARQRGYPVASVLNKAGRYAQPTAQNVAIALQAASINPDGTQVLGGVYANVDPRTYPVSSYSYMIVPTTTARPFSTEKGEVLGKFILYFVCAGQQKAEQLGYSPLPKNLVQIAFDAEKRIPGAPAPPAIETCDNPTITGTFTTANTPLPPAKGATTAAARTGGATGAAQANANAAVDPNAASASDATTGEDVGGQLVTASGPVAMPSGSASELPLYVIGLVLLAGVVFGPPAVALAIRKRDRASARAG
jgi:phosphate transport system substrate-binding protein